MSEIDSSKKIKLTREMMKISHLARCSHSLSLPGSESPSNTTNGQIVLDLNPGKNYRSLSLWENMNYIKLAAVA